MSNSGKDNIKIQAISDFNKSFEPIYGYYATFGDKDYKITIVKSLLFIQCYKGCKANVELPEIYNTFLTLSNGKVIELHSGMNNIELDDSISGYGISHLKSSNSYK